MDRDVLHRREELPLQSRAINSQSSVRDLLQPNPLLPSELRPMRAFFIVSYSNSILPSDHFSILRPDLDLIRERISLSIVHLALPLIS